MPAFAPKQRSEIYALLTARVLADAPITSSELGEVTDNINFAIADQINEFYFEVQNSLALLRLDSTTGSDLDNVASEYPDLAPRFQSTNATGSAQVTDPTITKVTDSIDIGGSNAGDHFLNLDDASAFPATGSVLIGTRGSAVFETWSYSAKVGNQLTGAAAIAHDHGSGESVILTTVGDRTFNGPFTVSTEASAETPAKTFTSQSPLVIYDGEVTGSMNIEADVEGLIGNTPAGTIVKFIGNSPFPGAVVRNGAALINGTAREKDPDLRQRIRQQRQALSTGNIDAVTSALTNAVYQGQRVVFSQVDEDVDPTLPDIAYIDDGSGFVPTQELYTTPIVLIDAAVGGEKKFQIPYLRRPIVTTPTENVSRVFSNITLKLNGVTLVQGDGANQYRVQPDRGVLRLNFQLVPGDHLEITSIRYYTGLVQVANWFLYGVRENRAKYPGINSLGAWVQIKTPAAQFVTVQGNVTLDGSRPINDVVNDVKQNILSYINGLGIGNTVVRNRLVALSFVPGVKDFTLLLPVGDVIIPDGTLARATIGNIIIS